MESLMNAYKGTFKKRNGESRQMVFARIWDLPEPFLKKHVQGAGNETKYPEGMELVWDLEADSFRIFNWKTIEGKAKHFNIDSTLFEVK